MAEFNRSQVFNGTCAPILYFKDCTPKARESYMIASRFWLAANSVALIALVISFIRRYIKVQERFNTLRLAMVFFGIGLPLHIAYDALRVSDINQHGTPFPLLGFLWLTGFVPPLSGVMLLIVTWVSFSTKSLMSRPALTGHPVLFWSLFTPFVVSNLVQGALCGINYWVYFIVMRVIISSWSALCIILSIFAGYYGTQTLKKISATKNSFNYAQQMRLLIFIIVMMICCSISLIFHAYFLTDIDLIPGVFFLITSVYRLSSFTVATGSAVYAWIATSHYISQSSHGSTSKSHSEGNRHSMIRSTSAAAASATAPRNVIVDSDDDSETSGETAALPADPASTPAIAHRQSDFDQPELSSTDEDEEEEEEEEEEEDE